MEKQKNIFDKKIKLCFSASGCPHANKNRTRTIETSLGMGAGGLLKYGGLIKPSIHPYPPPPGT